MHEYILDTNHKLMKSAREFNVTIRWLILHTTSQAKKIRDIIVKDFKPQDLLMLIMKTAQYEFTLKSLYQELLSSKEQRWDNCKKEGSERMKELSKLIFLFYIFSNKTILL